MTLSTRSLAALTAATMLTSSLPGMAAAEPDSEPLKRSDLPLPVVIDGQSGDVAVTLDGETVNITGEVNATLDEPVEVTGSVNATLDEPVEVTGSVYAETPDPTVPASDWRNRYIDGPHAQDGNPASADYTLPPYLFAMHVSASATEGFCKVGVVAFDAANGEPDSNTNPFIQLAFYDFIGVVTDSALLPTRQYYPYPGGIDFTDWTTPTMRVAVQPIGATDRCVVRLFLTASNVPAG